MKHGIQNSFVGIGGEYNRIFSIDVFSEGIQPSLIAALWARDCLP
jgi:hypothetical protein